MKVFVDISNPKLSYEYFTDVMNFYINGAKKCTICFRNLNTFILKYAYKNGFVLESVNAIPKNSTIIIFGVNNALVEECKKLKLNYKYLGDYNGLYSIE